MLDLDAAIAYITGRAESETSLDAISLIGYSFGSWVLTHQAIENEWVDNYVLIAPPLTFYDFAHLTAGNGGLTKPKLIIAGDSDTVCPIAELEAFHSRLADPKTLHVLAKTNHFLLRAEEKIVTFCQNFIER
jgi:alpha/beta superfamily hydrolase